MWPQSPGPAATRRQVGTGLLAHGSLHTFNVEGSSVPGRGIRACIHPCTHPSIFAHTHRHACFTHSLCLPQLCKQSPVLLSMQWQPLGHSSLGSSSRGCLAEVTPAPESGWHGGCFVPWGLLYFRPHNLPPLLGCHPSPWVCGRGDRGTCQCWPTCLRPPGRWSCGCTHIGLYSGHIYHIQR